MLALVDLAAARVDVDHILGVDQTTLVLDQPIDAVVRSAFFAGRESENQVAIGNEAFSLFRRRRVVTSIAAPPFWSCVPRP